MTWVKLDDGFCTNPKVIALSDRAFRAYVAAICYCAANLTDGVIPNAARHLIGKAPALDELVRVGMLTIVEDGYSVHDYLEYNPSRERVLADRRGSAARQARARNGVSNGVTNAASHAVPSHPNPIPSKSEEEKESPSGLLNPIPTPIRNRNHGSLEQVIKRG